MYDKIHYKLKKKKKKKEKNKAEEPGCYSSQGRKELDMNKMNKMNKKYTIYWRYSQK